MASTTSLRLGDLKNELKFDCKILFSFCAPSSCSLLLEPLILLSVEMQSCFDFRDWIEWTDLNKLNTNILINRSTDGYYFSFYHLPLHSNSLCSYHSALFINKCDEITTVFSWKSYAFYFLLFQRIDSPHQF